MCIYWSYSVNSNIHLAHGFGTYIIKRILRNLQKKVGKDLFALFLKRNPRIILRKPVGTSINRINSFIHDAIKNTSNNQVLVMEKLLKDELLM